LGERGGALLREHAHDVALGQDAGHPAVRAEHEQRADPVLGELLRRGLERRRGIDRDDAAAFDGEKGLDGHVSPPLTGVAPSARNAGQR
jgi:hypothetical protein